MTEELNEIYSELRNSNEKTLTHLENELVKVRAGKATPSMLHGVMVDYYGSPTPLHQVANIGTIDARTISVQPWEKAMLNEIAKGIINSNLGLNPQNNGEQLIITVPPLTEERRRELTKFIKGEGEQTKVAIRNLRRDANEAFKRLVNDKEISEDDDRRAQAEIQKLTDKFVAEVDQVLQAKEAEIMTV